MAATTIERPTKTPQDATSGGDRPSLNPGKVAIIWDPARDREVPAPPQGSQSTRSFIYEWTDQANIERINKMHAEAAMQGRYAAPQAIFCEQIELKPGLNWVDEVQWQKAVEDSAAMKAKRGFDLIGDLMASSCEAIKVGLTAGANAGSIDSYEFSFAIQIVEQSTDIGELNQWLTTAKDRIIQERIRARIGTLINVR